MDVQEDEWFQSKPECVQELIRKVPPGEYVMVGTGQYVHIYSYFEDGTVSVVVDVEKSFNKSFVLSALPENYRVFGVSPKSLIPILEES